MFEDCVSENIGGPPVLSVDVSAERPQPKPTFPPKYAPDQLYGDAAIIGAKGRASMSAARAVSSNGKNARAVTIKMRIAKIKQVLLTAVCQSLTQSVAFPRDVVFVQHLAYRNKLFPRCCKCQHTVACRNRDPRVSRASECHSKSEQALRVHAKALPATSTAAALWLPGLPTQLTVGWSPVVARKSP